MKTCRRRANAGTDTQRNLIIPPDGNKWKKRKANDLIATTESFLIDPAPLDASTETQELIFEKPEPFRNGKLVRNRRNRTSGISSSSPPLVRRTVAPQREDGVDRFLSRNEKAHDIFSFQSEEPERIRKSNYVPRKKKFSVKVPPKQNSRMSVSSPTAEKFITSTNSTVSIKSCINVLPDRGNPGTPPERNNSSPREHCTEVIYLDGTAPDVALVALNSIAAVQRSIQGKEEAVEVGESNLEDRRRERHSQFYPQSKQIAGPVLPVMTSDMKAKAQVPTILVFTKNGRILSPAEIFNKKPRASLGISCHNL